MKTVMRHEARQVPSWLIFDVGQKMSAIHPPLAVVERGDEEFCFFSSVDDAVRDRFDILWADDYDGWDSSGQYFSLVRKEGPCRWWHRLLAADRTFLVIDRVQPSFRSEEAARRIRAYLKAPAEIELPELLALGVSRDQRPEKKQ